MRGEGCSPSTSVLSVATLGPSGWEEYPQMLFGIVCLLDSTMLSVVLIPISHHCQEFAYSDTDLTINTFMESEAPRPLSPPSPCISLSISGSHIPSMGPWGEATLLDQFRGMVTPVNLQRSGLARGIAKCQWGPQRPHLDKAQCSGASWSCVPGCFAT